MVGAVQDLTVHKLVETESLVMEKLAIMEMLLNLLSKLYWAVYTVNNKLASNALLFKDKKKITLQLKNVRQPVDKHLERMALKNVMTTMMR